ncbi:MAG: hypothetical protein ACUVTD_09590 [Nitrososphaerales archaeon]
MVEEKEERIMIKSNEKEFHVEERDYRAFIAIILTCGLIALLWKGDLTSASVLAPLDGMAIAWYFKKEK